MGATCSRQVSATEAQTVRTSLNAVIYAIAESSTPALLVDTLGYVRHVNHAACTLLQYSTQELTDSDFDMFLPPRLRARDGAAWPSILTMSSSGFAVHVASMSVLCKDGTECLCKIAAQPIPDTTTFLVYITVANPSNARIEALEAEVRVAETSVRHRGMFLARMSHELRTPLNGIVISADLMQASSLLPEQRETLQTILTCCDMTLTVINDILDFSKIDSGMLVLDSALFRVGDVVDDVVSIFRPIADTKGITLSSSIDAVLHEEFLGDRHRFRQVLVNLVSNAVKFTHYGTVTIVARPKLGVLEGGAAALSVDISVQVTDTGIGMTENVISRLFQPFVQVSPNPIFLSMANLHSVLRVHANAAILPALTRSTTASPRTPPSRSNTRTSCCPGRREHHPHPPRGGPGPRDCQGARGAHGGHSVRSECT